MSFRQRKDPSKVDLIFPVVMGNGKSRHMDINHPIFAGRLWDAESGC